MKRELRWEHEAIEQFFEIAVRDSKLARRVLIAVRGYRMGQRVDLKKLGGRSGSWRIRVGDWRILLVVEGEEAIVESIDNRRAAY